MGTYDCYQCCDVGMVEKTIAVPCRDCDLSAGRISDAEFFDRAKQLFHQYAEWFGLDDASFPADEPQEKQCEFEEKFRELMCQRNGHDMHPDHCMKPEHDCCGNCRGRRDTLTGWIANDFRTEAPQ